MPKDKYKILEAWQLFVHYGISKTESLTAETLRQWHYAKIQGIDPQKTEILIRRGKDYKSKLFLDEIISSWANGKKYKLFLLDEEMLVQDMNEVKIETLKIELGAILEEKYCGICAFHSALKLNQDCSMSEAEHYVKAMHSLDTFASTFNLKDGRYVVYLCSDVSIGNINIEECKIAIEEYKNRLLLQSEKNILSPTYYNTAVVYIDQIGEIKKTESNAYRKGFEFLKSGNNLLKSLKYLSLAQLFSGKKQICKIRHNYDEVVILTPLYRTESQKLAVSVEKLDESQEVFMPLLKKYRPRQLFEKSKLRENNLLLKRLSITLESEYPLILVSDKKSDHVLCSSLISSMVDKIVFTQVYEVERREVDDILSLQMGEQSSRVLPHQVYDDCIYDIYFYSNEHVLEKENVYKGITNQFKTKNCQSKLIIHMGVDAYAGFSKQGNEIMGVLKLYTILFDERYREELALVFSNSVLKAEKDKLTLNYIEEKGEEINLHKLKPSYNGINYGDIREVRYETDIQSLEKQAIIEALISCDYSISIAVKKLKISRSTLYRKMKKYGIKKYR